MATLHDQRYAEIIQDKGLADQEKIAKAQEDAERAVMEGKNVSLLDTLVTTGAIDEQQKQEVLNASEAAGPIVLGDFEIEKLLGQGGMGAVYLAREISLDRPCALKLLPAHLAKEPSIISRFRREAQACAKLDHPHIIHGYRYGDEGGQHYFAMELVKGTSVERDLKKGPMDIDRAVTILKEIASALAYAHKNGMIHRDIKPDNIMITEGGVSKLADLGLVKAADTDQTRITTSGTGMGTPAYMPPEQARGAKHVDERSDIYALGATLYHMVTGKMPYTGASAYEVMQQHERGVLKSPRALRPDCPQWLDLVIGKMMQRKPENRFANCEALLEVVNRHTGDESTLTPPGQKSPGPKKPADRYWHLQIKKPDGTIKKAKAETHNLRQLIKTGQIPLTTLAKRGNMAHYKPLSEYPRLMEPVKAAQSGTRRDKVGLSAAYGEVEAAAKKRARMRTIKRIAVRAVLALIVLGALGGGFMYRAEIIEWVKGLTGGG